MKTGDLIRLTHFANYLPGLTTHWKAPKDAVFVAVMLGVEAKDGTEPFNLIDIFAEMGWIPDPDKWDGEMLAKIGEDECPLCKETMPCDCDG